MDFTRFQFVTFDCYGTLIDWESGILAALRPVFNAHGKDVGNAEVLAAFARLERDAEAAPYRSYRRILESIVHDLGELFGFAATAAEEAALPESIGRWAPFPDTVAALRALKQRFRLGILSNVDDDLFAGTASLLGVEFDVVITAQQVGAYKPSPRNFEAMRGRLETLGIAQGAWLHVAQSRAHDIAPAKALGLANVWVNRPRPYGASAVLEAPVKPDATVKSLAELAALVERS